MNDQQYCEYGEDQEKRWDDEIETQRFRDMLMNNCVKQLFLETAKTDIELIVRVTNV